MPYDVADHYSREGLLNAIQDGIRNQGEESPLQRSEPCVEATNALWLRASNLTNPGPSYRARYKYRFAKASLILCFIYLNEWESAKDVLEHEYEEKPDPIADFVFLPGVGHVLGSYLVVGYFLNPLRRSAEKKDENREYEGLSWEDYQTFSKNVEQLIETHLA